MNFELGMVTLIRGIVFDDRVKHEIDHAMTGGRPCVLVGINEADEELYFLPLTSCKYKDGTQIVPNKINLLKKTSNVNIKTIITKNIAFYETHGKIENEDMYKMYKRILSYYKEETDIKEVNILKKVATAYVNKYENKLVKFVDKNGCPLKYRKKNVKGYLK